MQRYVLLLFLTILLTWAISLPRSVPTRGALEAFAAEGTGTVPQLASQAGWREALGSLVLDQVSTPKSTVREVPSGSSIKPSPSSRAATRATLDHPEGSQRKLRAHRCWLFDITTDHKPASQRDAPPSRHPPPVMAGPVPAIPIR